MRKKRMNQWILLMVVYFGFSVGECEAQKKDFSGYAGFTRYAKENAALPKPGRKEKRVVFMGNSITQGWVKKHPDFFASNGYIGRGIGGQTSYQFLARFREDVVNLSPALVIINAGTNDIAENTQPYNEDYTFGNIISMVEIAQANKIKVILSSVLPAAEFKWRLEIRDAPQKIKSLNARIKAYAKAHKIPYADYYSAMVVPETGAMDVKYSKEGVHPMEEGYDVMESVIQKIIKKTL